MDQRRGFLVWIKELGQAWLRMKLQARIEECERERERVERRDGGREVQSHSCEKPGDWHERKKDRKQGGLGMCACACAKTDARDVDTHRGACEALGSCVLCAQASCLPPDACGWNFASKELWAVNQHSVYSRVLS